MALNVGLPIAAAVVLCAAVPVGVVGHGRSRDVPCASRVALRTMGAAVAVTVAWWLVSGALEVFGDGRFDRNALALPGAIGVPLSLLLMLAGIERLAGIVDSADTRLRWRVDIWVLTPALFLSGWILTAVFGNGGKQIRLHATWSVLASAPAVVTATLALGFGIVTTLRSVTAQRAIAVLMGAVVAIGIGGTLAVTGLLAGSMPPVLWGAGVVGGGLLVLGWCAITQRHLLEPSTGARTGWAMSVVTISVALVMIITEVLRTGSLDAVGASAGVMTGFALVSRQGLALYDSNQMAQRLREDEVHLRRLAYADPLTGVANRRELLRVLHSEAIEGRDCVLLTIDLDGFKHVNDLRGHDVGDAVLVEVAHRLRANLHPGDLAARLGGDEFAVLMWAGIDDAETAAVRLLSTLGLPYQTDAGSVFVSASIGLAGRGSANDVPALLRNADLALRFAKMRGKDRVERYDEKYDRWLSRRTNIEHELRGAIRREELSLVFQPVVTLPAALPVGVEALLRWNHPTLGSVPPDEFIPIAEESGLIGQLDQWVLHHACRQLARWLDDGYDLWLAVNISVRELHLVDYVSQVMDTIRTHHVPPERLVLEVTEHTVAEDMDELVGKLSALRETGVRISLDDFGAGYSSLGQLRSLPVDILKIDRSLVGDPAGSATSRATRPLVDVVVRLGRKLGLQVIAEGVAEPAERAIVEAAGCRLGQGDLFGRAMPTDHLEALLSAAFASPPDRAAIPRPRGTTTAQPAT